MFGTDFSTVPGGKGLNQAVAAARAGGDVGFLGAIGHDAFGDELRRCLRDDGVDTEGLTEVDAPTGTAHISVLDGGENAIVVVSGANAAITGVDHPSQRRIEDARYLVAQFERPIALISEAFVVARGLGIQTVLTPAPAQPVDHALLQLVDILIPNAQEACELAGVSDETEAAVALSRTVGLVVMTRGSRGVLARGQHEHGHAVARAPQAAADLQAVHIRQAQGPGRSPGLPRPPHLPGPAGRSRPSRPRVRPGSVRAAGRRAASGRRPPPGSAHPHCGGADSRTVSLLPCAYPPAVPPAADSRASPSASAGR